MIYSQAIAKIVWACATLKRLAPKDRLFFCVWHVPMICKSARLACPMHSLVLIFCTWSQWCRALALRGIHPLLGSFNSQGIANMPFESQGSTELYICKEKHFPNAFFFHKLGFSKTDFLQNRLCHDRSRQNRFRKKTFF